MRGLIAQIMLLFMLLAVIRTGTYFITFLLLGVWEGAFIMGFIFYYTFVPFLFCLIEMKQVQK